MTGHAGTSLQECLLVLLAIPLARLGIAYGAHLHREVPGQQLRRPSLPHIIEAVNTDLNGNVCISPLHEVALCTACAAASSGAKCIFSAASSAASAPAVNVFAQVAAFLLPLLASSFGFHRVTSLYAAALLCLAPVAIQRRRHEQAQHRTISALWPWLKLEITSAMSKLHMRPLPCAPLPDPCKT